jgi:hypothetical protein
MSDAPGRWRREIGPLLIAALLPLLPDPGALVPTRAYFFRDFSVTFYPLRLFVARELREGRFPFWNPYIYEGSFGLPAFYPVDLLHAFWPGPAAVSWLLTLHLPLAAVGMYCLARSLGSDRAGGLLAGAVYALGGLSLSSLNLYVFLQALAIAPFLALALGRAARDGGRAIAVAAVLLAASISTLAVEFVAQALVVGAGLSLAAHRGRAPLFRIAAAVGLGIAAAALPIVVTASLVGETVRGAGFAREVALGNAIHPATLLQVVVPNLFGSLADPVGAWWGGAFFTKGLPYFLSLYLGPLALALAFVGAFALESRPRRILSTLAALGLWYSLGERAGLAAWLSALPGLSAFRFPGKAFFVVHFTVALLAGLGASRLARGEALVGFARCAGAVAIVIGALLGALTLQGPAIAAWARVEPGYAPAVLGAVARSTLLALFVVTAGAAGAVLAARRRLSPRLFALAVTALAVLDLVKAGAGMNPQAPVSFYAPLPEMAALGPAPAGERTFSYGLDHSPAFRRIQGLGPATSLAAFYLNRQLLGPYNNILDRVFTPEATDLTSFVPRPRELGPADYAPEAAERLVPWLKNAGVSRVLSLDPLTSPSLRTEADVPVVAGAVVHVYAVRDPAPLSYVACRVVPAATTEEALGRPYAEGFDLGRDVSLEAPGRAACASGRVSPAAFLPGDERLSAEADGDGFLVVRASYARGWRALVDGRPVPVLRANGKHRAVAIPAGRHDVRFVYEPPGLALGLLVSGLSALALTGLLWRPRGWRREQARG